MSYLSKAYHSQSSVLLFQTSLTYLCACGTVNDLRWPYLA